MLDYDGFVEKFKPKKTTDDCYTPDAVYEAVVKYVNDYVTPLDGVQVVRPFWPGGDYENHDYPDGCIVIDNPPFSLFTKIRRFYQLNNIKYFLFGPGLTIFRGHFNGGECFHIIGDAIKFENGALVSCSFVTNISNGDRIVLAGALDEMLAEIQRGEDTRRVLGYPKGVVSSAFIKKYVVKGEQFAIKDGDAYVVKDKNEPFGGAYVIPPQVVEELERGRERKREREREREREQERKREYIRMEPATMEMLRILEERYEERRASDGE